MVQIRDVINQALEKIFAGNIGVQEGLDQAVEKGNALLAKFQRANS